MEIGVVKSGGVYERLAWMLWEEVERVIECRVDF